MKGASPFERKKHGKVIVCSSYLPPGTFLEPWGTEDHGWCCGQQTLRRGGISVKITLAEEYARWWVFKKTKRKKKKNQNRFSFLLHLSSFLLFFHLSKRPGALVFLVWMELYTCATFERFMHVHGSHRHLKEEEGKGQGYTVKWNEVKLAVA